MGYQFNKITVLVVDSQPAIVAIIHDVLRMFGVTNIITRTDGKTALTAFEKNAPDLLIIDWDLDSIDGLEFTRHIRQGDVNPFTPIIFMTSFSSAKRVKAARDSGITEFLKKPFSAQALYKRIETVIEKPRDFVKSDGYFGPDRRRKRQPYNGPCRRNDPPVEIDFIDRKKQ